MGGVDRRTNGGAAGESTIDESVWATLRRDLLAVWAKLREVLYPRHLLASLLGGDADGGLGGAYARLREGGLAGARDAAGRVLDPEALVSGENAARGLREWDLWGPLVFCLLLSLLLSFNAREMQKEAVFSGVFAIVWIGETVVTLQIKLLGGNM